jgi:hypothetical protein
LGLRQVFESPQLTFRLLTSGIFTAVQVSDEAAYLRTIGGFDRWCRIGRIFQRRGVDVLAGVRAANRYWREARPSGEKL